MAKMKRISVSSFEKAAGIAERSNTKYVGWNDIEIAVRETLPLVDMMTFVSEAVSSCFDEDTGEFMPEVKDFIIKINTIEYYTNITLPANIEKKYTLVYASDIVAFILKHIDLEQYNEIVYAINSRVEHISSAYIEEVRKNINKFSDSLEGFQNRITEICEGLDSDKLNSILNSLNSASKLGLEGVVNSQIGGTNIREGGVIQGNE